MMTDQSFPFKDIKLSEMSEAAALSDLLRAFEVARYGALQGGKARSKVRCGIDLLSSTDFCRSPSGLVDQHDVRFPADSLPNTVEEAEGRFRWMIHAPRNPDVIRSLINALRPFWEDGDLSRYRGAPPIKYSAVMKKPDPAATARELFALRPIHPSFVKNLLSGDLVKAAAYLKREPPNRERLIRAFEQTSLFWLYLKMQIKAARLFHAEWNSADTGGSDAPRRLTIGTYAIPIGEARKHAVTAKRISAGEDVSADDRQALEQFASQRGLAELAAVQGQSYGFSSEQLAGQAPVSSCQMSSLVAFQSALDARTQPFADSFLNSRNTKTSTVYDLVHVNKPGNQKQKYAPPPKSVAEQVADALASEPKRRRESDMVAATARYGASTLTCLAYAVIDFYEAVAALSQRELSGITSKAAAEKHLENLQTLIREKSDARRNLISVYRAAITRDRSHMDEFRELFDRDGADDSASYKEEDEEPVMRHPIEPSPTDPLDSLNEIMGRGLLLEEKIYDVEFRLTPRGGPAATHPRIAYSAFLEAKAIRDWHPSGDAKADKVTAATVKWFRKIWDS